MPEQRVGKNGELVMWFLHSISEMDRSAEGKLKKKSDHSILSSENSKRDSPFRRQFFVTHTIRQTEFLALLDSWVKDIHSLKMYPQRKIAFLYMFVKT
jgi:hypothetical protein